jgi:hypothetical protein
MLWRCRSHANGDLAALPLRGLRRRDNCAIGSFGGTIITRRTVGGPVVRSPRQWNCAAHEATKNVWVSKSIWLSDSLNDRGKANMYVV